ncbi:intraflagellar transport protein 46 homolog isoform X1 [Elephas maximus indicus]|uniref:intraflagellar transport protein 46 homolog isoform X1 n=1 Tax=Elephas maximus indicus TaxID=99487 RepID=UPI002115E8BF|nr:intraflagellar transport protein 46 homolog isoform X1 [Elephas maximus indicus]
MADNSSDEYEEENNKEKKTSQLTAQRGFSENDDDDDDDDDDSSETDSDSDDDDEEHGAPLEGAYDPADYEHLPVSAEIKELFQYISRYTPQLIDLDHKLKPFIPDFIPAVGDIDAFLKVPRPDGKPDNLGLLVLDEPSTKQSDPTVLSLWLTENSKQHNISQHMKVKSLEDAEKNPKAIDTWIESISELHRSKPPATVHYTRPMPDIDTLMQEWSPEFEELLGKVSLPTAEIGCSLPEYIDMICAILDIPIYKSRIQSLHLLFSLYSEFKNSQGENESVHSLYTKSSMQTHKAFTTETLGSPWCLPSRRMTPPTPLSAFLSTYRSFSTTKQLLEVLFKNSRPHPSLTPGSWQKPFPHLKGSLKFHLGVPVTGASNPKGDRGTLAYSGIWEGADSSSLFLHMFIKQLPFTGIF